LLAIMVAALAAAVSAMAAIRLYVLCGRMETGKSMFVCAIWRVISEAR